MRNVIEKIMYCALVLCATICFVACDKKDDPVPEPTPTPDDKYSGCGVIFELDSCFGDTSAFNKMLVDSVKKICPKIKVVDNRIFMASIAFQEKDSAEVESLRDQSRELFSYLRKLNDLDKPVVTTAFYFLRVDAVSPASKNWEISWKDSSQITSGGHHINTAVHIMIPSLGSCVWGTTDVKGQNINKINFKGKTWDKQKDGYIYSMSVEINDGEEYIATRQGTGLFLYKNKDVKTSSYDFHVYGDKLKLIKVEGTALADDRQPEYVVESNIKQ